MTRFPAREALGQRLQRRLGSALCCLVAEAAGRPPDYLDDLLVIHSRSPANAGVRTSCTSAFVRCGRTRIPRPGRSSNALDRLVMRASRRLDPAAFGAGPSLWSPAGATGSLNWPRRFATQEALRSPRRRM